MNEQYALYMRDVKLLKINLLKFHQQGITLWTNHCWVGVGFQQVLGRIGIELFLKGKDTMLKFIPTTKGYPLSSQDLVDYCR